VGLPEIDEVEMMRTAVKEIQAVTDLPLQIDTSDAEAMEAGMRSYNGKPLVNSVNGKEKVMREIFPLVKKYGGTVIALTIGEDGIPETAEGRLEIALNIVKKAEEYGIDKKDIIVDPLAMTISSDQRSARVALEVVKKLKEMGIKTSMGVSNISFGLPKRDLINSTFFANALEQGMNCAIMNPFSVSMMDVYHAFRALNGYDKNCMEYIKYAEERSDIVQASGAKPAEVRPECGKGNSDGLKYCIIKGMKDKAVKAAEAMLLSAGPLDVINDHIVPALDEVGKDFEEKRAYLPQLLLSAEAASAAFEVVKAKLPKIEDGGGKDVILATVKGDIHDIGKNIVKVLLQSYGFNVIDLGKDVSPETIRDCALEIKCSLVGLSALMTTTVPAMEETIKAIRATGEDIKVMVGGAVLSADYAEMIGADWYSPDGMDAVKYAERHYKGAEGSV
ncbi:MAG: dihydropteroate synthase, partial [Firmicutes bacterium]|nr:dihydropteroate synthase [Bacillota bacterium]